MASFVSANLSHELSEHFVTFKLDAVIRFAPQEVGHRWLLQYQFMEEDPMSDDKLSQLRPAQQVGDPSPGIKRHYIIPSKEEVEISYTEEFSKHLVDTEIGKEEVYATVELLPLEAPEGFVAGKTRTNITIVDV